MNNLRSLILLPFVVVQVVAAGCKVNLQAEDRQLRTRAGGHRVYPAESSKAAHALQGRRTGKEAPKPSARQATPVAVSR